MLLKTPRYRAWIRAVANLRSKSVNPEGPETFKTMMWAQPLVFAVVVFDLIRVRRIGRPQANGPLGHSARAASLRAGEAGRFR